MAFLVLGLREYLASLASCLAEVGDTVDWDADSARESRNVQSVSTGEEWSSGKEAQRKEAQN